MTGLKVLPSVALGLAAVLVAAPAGQTQDQPVRLSIVVDKSCLIQPESDPLVLDDHSDAFRNDAICRVEKVLSSHHIEEKLTEGERSRFFVRVAEQEYIVQNPTDQPAVFIIRHDVPENWIVDSNTPPSSMDGSTAVYRINAEPAQRVGLHVGTHRSYAIRVEPWDVVRPDDIPPEGAQHQPVPLTVVVDKSCLIQPESDPLVLGGHSDAFRDDAICKLESVFSPHHIEEKLTDSERSRFLVRGAEQEYVVQNPTDQPAVFVIRHDVPENWIVDSNTPPSSMDGSTAVYRVNAEPGQRARLHVGIHRSDPIDPNELRSPSCSDFAIGSCYCALRIPRRETRLGTAEPFFTPTTGWPTNFLLLGIHILPVHQGLRCAVSPNATAKIAGIRIQ